MAGDRLSLTQVQETYGQLPTLKEVFYDWYGLNTWLFKLINGIHDPNYDVFMYVITQLGNKNFFVPYMVVIGVYALGSILYRKLFRKGGVRQHFILWVSAFAVMVASFAAYAVLAWWLKDYFEYARPYVLIEGAVQVEPKRPEDAYRSLPSGHVAFISVIVLSLWPLLSHHMRLFGLFLIALVAWSRVSLGVHFPADTLWAFLLGFAIVLSVRATVYTLFRKLFGIHCDGD